MCVGRWQVPLLVAIDGYEALYLPSQYGEWTSQHRRRRIQPSELRLAASMQVLHAPPPRLGFVVCADSGTRKQRSVHAVGAPPCWDGKEGEKQKRWFRE